MGNIFDEFLKSESETSFSTSSFKLSIQEYPTPSENCSFCLQRTLSGNSL